jgi:hypothetical protein
LIEVLLAIGSDYPEITGARLHYVDASHVLWSLKRRNRNSSRGKIFVAYQRLLTLLVHFGGTFNAVLKQTGRR